MNENSNAPETQTPIASSGFVRGQKLTKTESCLLERVLRKQKCETLISLGILRIRVWLR